MSKNGKKAQKISEEAKTAFIFALVCIILGLACVVFGLFGYKSSKMVDTKDIQTGQSAEIISVQKISRNLSEKEKEIEKNKGLSGDELRYEYSVRYKLIDSDKEYTFTDTKPYRNGRSAPAVGDTELVSYAIKDGELILHPETSDVNQFTVCGWFLVILGVLSSGVGYFIRK